MRHYGDFDPGTNIHGKFTTVANTTAVATALNNGNCIVFKDNGTANSVAGLTLTANFGSQPGYNHWNINTGANSTFYSAGSFFDVMLANGTVGGSSVANYSVGSFTLRADSALKPATAGRTVVIDSGGTAQANVTTWLGTAVVAFGAANGPVINGINGGNITTTLVANVTGNMTGSVGSVNGNIGGNVAGSVNSVNNTVNASVTQWLGVAPQQLGAANGIVVNGINGGNITATVVLTGNIAGNMTGSVGSVNGNIGGNILGNMNGNVGGNVVGSVGSVLGAVGSVTGAVGSVTGNVGGSVVGTVASVTGDIAGNVNGNVIGSVANILVGGATFIANTHLDLANAIETGITPRLAHRYTVSAVAGNLSGGNEAVVVIAGAGVATPRITANVEANGNTRIVALS